MINCLQVQEVQRAMQNLHEKIWGIVIETAAAQIALNIFYKGQLSDIASL